MGTYDKKFMRRAVELARQGVEENAGGPFGAVIVKDGKIIAEANNHVLASGDPTAHAEVLAIRRACEKLGTFQLDGCELYASCEPCPMCLGAIYWARLSEVFFANTRAEAVKIGFDDARIYDEMKTPLENRQIPFVKVSLPKAREAFLQWQQKPDKTQY